MRFLTIDESQQWLAPLGVSIGKDRALLFDEPSGRKTRSLIAQLPDKPLKLTYFLERAIDWLPRANERFLWFSDWSTYPPHPYAFFESVRRGYGEHRPLIEIPGCMFNPDYGAIGQEFSEEPDTSTLIGLSLLVVNFDWRAFLVVKDQSSRVFFGDEDIWFSTSESAKLDEACALLDRFGLQFKQIK